MEITGYSASIFIGISLGLIGGGGSILTVPVLVYLFTVDTVLATTYSLFIVGSTSLVGSFSYFRKGLMHLRTALLFGGPSIVSVFFTRHYILTAIPDHVFDIGSWKEFRDSTGERELGKGHGWEGIRWFAWIAWCCGCYSMLYCIVELELALGI